MKSAAARKHEKGYGKHNLGQYPVFLDNPDDKRSSSTKLHSKAIANSAPQDKRNEADEGATESAKLTSRTASMLDAGMANPISSLSSTGYEAMRVEFDFDLLDLSALTTFHVARSTAQFLLAEPSRLLHVLRCRQWSYFSYLPSRYGQSRCLDDAARCVAARIRQWVCHPGKPDDAVLALYAKALKSLQGALNDPLQCTKPDVLCATQIMAIHELLDTARDQAWVHHVTGAATLMKLRGPGNYITEFEKALFLAQVGQIYSESIANKSPCFLEQPAWQIVLESTVLESSTFSSCSDIVISLWKRIVPIPSLFNGVQDAICGPLEASTKSVGELLSRALRLRQQLLDWRQLYDRMLASTFLKYHSLEISEDGVGSDKRFEILGVCLATQIVLNRAIVAMNPDMAEFMEYEAQQLAEQILEIEKEACKVNPRAAVFMTFKLVIANATLSTKESWLIQSVRGSANNLMDPEVFEHWVALQGRKTGTSAGAPVQLQSLDRQTLQ